MTLSAGDAPTHHIVSVEDTVARAQIESLTNMLPEMVQTAVAAATEHALTAEEREWVRLAVIAAGKKAQFREDVMRKTLAGVALMLLAAIGGATILIIKGWLVSLGIVKP